MNPSPSSAASGDALAAAREAVERFEAALDRRVVASRAGTMLAAVAGATIALIGCVCLAAALRNAGLPIPPLVVWLAMGISALASLRRTWPGRLETARELERASPPLGERISRAVGLLPESAGGTPAGLVQTAFSIAGTLRPLAPRLIERTAEEASRALAQAADGPLPSVRLGRLRAGVCGGLLLILGLSTGLLPHWRRSLIETVVGEAAGPGVGARAWMPPTPTEADRLPRRQSAPGAALPEAAARGIAIHRMLAAELANRFARGPGLERQEISADERDWLDHAAGLQEEVADDLLQALAGEEGGAWRDLATGQATGLKAIPSAIRANRLARAMALTESFLEAADAAGLATAFEQGALFETVGPLVSGTRPPADAAALAAARLARLIDPQLGRDTPPAHGQRPPPVDAPGAQKPLARGDAVGTPAGETRDTATSVAPGGGDGAGPLGSRASAPPGSVDVGPAAAEGPAASPSAEAWVAERDRRPGEAMDGLAGTLSEEHSLALDRYFSILAGEDDLREHPR